MNSNFYKEVKSGQRFRFGNNWKNYLKSLSTDKIKVAEDSLLDKLGMSDLKGLKFLDIGSGSGLFSLAATNLGAQVFSMDFDPESIRCAKYLKQKYHVNSAWEIHEGSVLDTNYLKSLGKFDIVYSWGVLHHTGNMYLALKNALIPLKSGGKLFISIYNDQGLKSIIWKKVKLMYNANVIFRGLITALFFFYYSLRFGLIDVFKLRNPYLRYRNYSQNRGMSMWIDWIDWLGGYPFEVASPGQIVEFYSNQGLEITKIETTKSGGTNEFVFVRTN